MLESGRNSPTREVAAAGTVRASGSGEFVYSLVLLALSCFVHLEKPMKQGSRVLLLAISLLALLSFPAFGQPLQKSAIQVDPGTPPTKQIGATFGYRLTYNCANTSGPCLNAQVVDLLPAQVQYVSTVPASPTGDVAAINVTPNFGGSGRTRVQFVMVTPLTAGNSGDLIINVRFPNGSTPNGTDAVNAADGINLQTTPGTFTTPSVTVRAVGTLQATLTKTLTSSPANLDLPESYRLRISNPNANGALNITAIGPVTDTLPTGTVFNGAAPAADCEPGCIGTTPATLTWTAPCSVPLAPNANCDITVNVTFPSATFTSGTNVTNNFSATVTPLGGSPTGLGPVGVTHPVTTFVPAPSASQSKGFAGQPQPPTINMNFAWSLGVGNNGNVPLDNFSNIDTLPPHVDVVSVTTGNYTAQPPATVTVSYEKNTALGIFTLWGSSAGNVDSTLTAPPPGLGAGEYITRLRWDYGTVQPGFTGSARINAFLRPTTQTGTPVNPGDAVSNCVALAAVYTPGPTNVTRNNCHNFNVAGPFTRSSPSKINLSGGGPFNPGQTISWELRANNENFGPGSFPIVNPVISDLLPLDLVYTAGSQACIDATCTGMPPAFVAIPNYDNTGRTLLRWTFTGSLLPGEDVRVGYQTTVRQGALSGNLSNSVGQSFPPNGTTQRCASSTVDANDIDGDGDRTDSLCTASATAAIAPIAQLISSKQIRSVCDPLYGASSNGTLIGASLEYKLRVQNVGTVPMTSFVLVDILPSIGDTGVIDTNPRGSQWTPLLVAPIIPPPSTTLYYSTAANPCRGEVGGPVSGCDPPNWSTVPPVPVSATRSVKIEFGAKVVAPYDTIEFEFQMVAPGSALNGQQVFNSFGYLAQRGDGLGSLSAEPVKVGTTIGTCLAATLGDYVWVDSNGDGQQNDGQTGVNGVFAELFTPGADGIPHNLDDVSVSGTITANDPSNNPGWYRFGTLAPGDYYVCFHPPASYGITTPDVGSDLSDSDGDGNVCTPVTNLSAGEDDPTLDLGLLPPVPAALGNYVWFDSNSDGIQNEPTTSGVNGVSVRLWADDFDGVREPGTGDVLVATAVTADDIYGQPGYYLFPDLIPGQPYFVEFVLPPAATGFTSANSGGDDNLDSDAGAGGLTAIVTLASAEVNLSVDAGLVRAAGTLALGDQVWFETDNDGIYEPQDGEVGVDGVELSLYVDANNDGLPSAGEHVASTATATSLGFVGRYRFSSLLPGNYIVVVDASNFTGSGALSGRITSSGNNPAPDPDDDVNGDDNGADGSGAVVFSRPLTLASPEPTAEDGDNTTNLTVDFGFVPATPGGTPQYDYGDDPDAGAGTGLANYQTTAVDNGAYHQIFAGAPFLGSCVDADSGFFNNAQASGDDLVGWGLQLGTCAVPGDDEDGVTLPASLNLGSAVNVPVHVAATGGGCLVNAWFDWNADGDFLDVGEQVATDQAIASGATQNLLVNVPGTATPGLTYARFRCATASGLGPTGGAADGEVEDYVVSLAAADLGDAPASYGTTLPGGARHLIDPADALYLGSCVDFEADGQPGATTTGDDQANGTGRVGLCADDEDGVVFGSSPIVACSNLGLTITASGPGLLSAWADWNGNGSFGDAGEMILDGSGVGAGANARSIPVPCGAQPGNVYFRFRLADTEITSPTGDVTGGEVEDYVLGLLGNDLADLPDSYGTTVALSGPRHAVAPAANFRLGACVDTEADGQPTVPANGDDLGAGLATQGTCAAAGDDEDGVTFAAPAFVACTTTSLTVNASAGGGFLNAWVDWNADGDFGDFGEQIATGLALTAGNNVVNVTTPCAAQPTTTGARFRFSSVAALGPTDAGAGAPDGEVEDYRVAVLGSDFGDLPDTFLTTAAAGGAMHVVDPAAPLHLGVCVDTEATGAPTPGATGDDVAAGTSAVGACGGPDDENGVSLPVFVACLARNVTVTLPAGQSGRLDAFVDWNQNGVFDLPAEQIADDQVMNAGPNVIAVTAPCSSPPGGSVGARFRLSPAGVAGPAGTVLGGEVEDYVATVEVYDFGDAPNTYGTTTAAGGPSHSIPAGGGTPLVLGSCVDTEQDALAPLDASGDDGGAGNLTFGTCATPGDDEDGVDFGGPLVACQTRGVIVTASAGGRLDAWIDWNLDGDFLDLGEQVATSLPVVAGPNTLNVAVPCGLDNGDTFSRFRISSGGGLGPNGPAVGGEVEDHPVLLRNSDFGDAPDSYGTTLAATAARHGIASAGYSLGATVDAEIDGQPSVDALGDGADEDGVTFSATRLTACEDITATVVLTDTAGKDEAKLDAWVDFDGDGAFDNPRDRIAAGVDLVPGANAVVFTVPCDVPQRLSSYARFRLSTTGIATPTGPAEDGEVEDYTVELEQPLIGVAKEAVSVERAVDDPHTFLVLYRFRVENFSVVPVNGFQLVEDLSTTYAQAVSFSIESVTSSDFTVNPGYDGAGDPNLLAVGNTLAPLATGTVDLVVRVDPGGHAGPYENTVIATGTTPGDVPVTDISDDGDDPDDNDNQDPTDDEDPTLVDFPIEIVVIPTLDQVGKLLLALVLAVAAFRSLRR